MAEKIVMLALSPTMETGTIIKWNAKEGERIKSGEVICEVETDKAAMEYENMIDGTILKIIIPEGSNAAVGQTIAVAGDQGEDIKELLAEIKKEKFEPGKDSSPKEKPIGKSLEKEELTPPANTRKRIKSSPLARRIIVQKGLELSAIQGSGPDGRIVKKDVTAAAAAATGISHIMLERRIPISTKRRIIAERMTRSKFSAPHYYLKVCANPQKIVYTRTELNQGRSSKLSLNAFLIKITAEALRKHPKINAGWTNKEIIQFGSVDIALAVAQKDGLVAPIVRNCHEKGIEQIDTELHLLVEKAKENKLTSEDYEGATFTISNLGSLGIDEFTAVINPPGSAILAIGRIHEEPAVDLSGKIEIHKTMHLTLSCDHRVIDGAAGAVFLRDVKAFIENPLRTLI